MCTPEFLQQFRQHLAKLPQYHFQQDPDWYLCNAGPDLELLVTYFGDEIVASSVVRKASYRFTRKARYIVRNGPLYRDNRSLSAHLKEFQSGVSGSTIDIRISPPTGADNKAGLDGLLSNLGFGRYRCYSGNYTSTIAVDLTNGLESVSAAFSPALKRQLRKAETGNASIARVQETKGLRELLELTRSFYLGRGIGFPQLDVLDCYMGRKILDRGEGIALSLMIGAESVAGIIVIGCGDRAIFSSGFRKEDSSLNRQPLSHLLHVHAINWAAENGYRLYDFGGYSEEGADNGINRFKLGFSGRIETVSDNYLYSFHPVVTSLSNFLDRFRNRSSVRAV